MEARRPSHLRSRQQALRRRKNHGTLISRLLCSRLLNDELNDACSVTGVAQRVSGGDGAERHKDMGDGAVAQDAAGGLQVHQPHQVQVLRQREERADGGGDAGAGELQRLAPDLPAAGVPVLQGRRRDLRVVTRCVPDGVPSWVRMGGAPRVLGASGHRVQVQALGLHGGPLQRSCPHRGAR